MAGDEQDVIRTICVESIISIAKILSRDENQRLMLPIFLGIFEDKSWKVRLSIANLFPELSKEFGKEIVEANFISKYSMLLKDIEADVRTAAVKSLKKCLKNISPGKLQSLILPQLSTLIKDNTYNVRAGLGETLCEICKIVSKEVAIAQILPLLIELIQDEHHEVKMGVLRGLNSIPSSIGLDLLSA